MLNITIIYKIFFLIILLFAICFLYGDFENFEQVKIKLKQNPFNINLNNNINGGSCDNSPDIIVPIYAPWRTYWPSNLVYPYYPFYPYYYNNYYY